MRSTIPQGQIGDAPVRLARVHRALVISAVLLAGLHVAAMVAIRPMFQISDEISYFAGVQKGALQLIAEDPAARRSIAPPDGAVGTHAAGKPLFQRTVGGLYLALAQVAPPSTAVVLLRLVLGVSAMLTVAFTYLVARQVAPVNPLVVVGAPLLVALHPVFVTYSAGITPDSLANAFATVAMWLLVRFAAGSSRSLEPFGLVAVALLAFLFKDTALFLFAGIGFAALARTATMRERFGSLRAAVRNDGWLAAAALLVASSPLLLLVDRVWQVLLHSANLRTLSEQIRTGTPAYGDPGSVTLSHYFQPVTLFKSFWGALANFGGNDVSLPDSMLVLLAVACSIAAAGLILQIVSPPASQSPHAASQTRRQLILFLCCGMVLTLQAPTRDLVLGTGGTLQGRWMFPMIGPFMVMLCLGWSRLAGERPHALPFIGHISASIAAYAIIGAMIPAFYDSFPEVYRTGNLFLRGPFGLEIDPSRTMTFVERPGWLRTTWVTGTSLVAFATAAFGWPVWAYAAMRRRDRRSREGR